MSVESRSAVLSAYITQSVKDALYKDAEDQGISLSRVVQNILASHYKIETDWAAGNSRGQGRPLQARGKFSEPFKAAILASRKTREMLAKESGFNSVAALGFLLRGSEVVLTDKTRVMVTRLAKAIRFDGEPLANH